MFCPKCGSQTVEGAEFCSSCGYKLVESKKAQKKGKKNKIVFAVVAILVVVAAVIGISLYNSNRDFVPSVRAWQPYDSTQGMPAKLGDVIDAIYPSAKWKNEKIEGDYYVTVSASFTDSDENEEELLFRIKVVPNGDMVNMTPYSVSSRYADGSSDMETGYENLNALDYMFDLYIAYDENLGADYVPAVDKLHKLATAGMAHHSYEELNVAFDCPKLWELEWLYEGNILGCSWNPDYAGGDVSFYVCLSVEDNYNVLYSDFETVKRRMENDGITVLGNGEIQLGDMNAKCIRYNQNGLTIQDYYYDNSGYIGLIRFSSTDNVLSLYAPLFDSILDSFYVSFIYTDVAENDEIPRWNMTGEFVNEDGSYIVINPYYFIPDSGAVAWTMWHDEYHNDDYYYDLYDFHMEDRAWNAEYFATLFYSETLYGGEEYSEHYFAYFVDDYGNIGFDDYYYNPAYTETLTYLGSYYKNN